MKSPMIPAYIDTLFDWFRSGLVALILGIAFAIFFVAVVVWDFFRAFWDTVICGKTEAQQLRDWTERE